jgi:hypothetical protein
VRTPYGGLKNGQPLHRQSGVKNRIRQVRTRKRGRLCSLPFGTIGGAAVARPEDFAEGTAGDTLRRTEYPRNPTAARPAPGR